MDIRSYQESDQDAVIDLWVRCELVRPWNDSARDIARKLDVQRELFLVGEVDGEVVATVMAGYEGHRGWVNYLAVDPDRQRGGHGRAMMREAERRMQAMGCPKVNLQVRSSNRAVIEFYERIGYQVEERVSFGKRLISDDG